MALGLVWLGNEMPLTEGSFSGPGTSSAFVHAEDDPFGSGVMYVYCPGPGGRFAWDTSLRNTGPLPVTILGSDPGPIPVDVISKTNSSWQDGLAAGRKATPANTLLATHDLVDAAHAALLTPSKPITIQPRDEVDLWVWYRTGTSAIPSGGREIIRSLRVRFSVLGFERVAEIPMHDGVGIEGSPCAGTPN